MSTEVPEYFQGFGVSDPTNWNKPKLVQFKHKPLKPYDVVIKVECCGICGSDVHTVKGNWGPYARNDLVVGHEVVGKVVYVGKGVTKAKLGQRVGLGAECKTCMECSRCKNNSEQYCPKYVTTYNGVDADADNYVTQGGYANYVTAHEHYTFPIPDKIASEDAGPLMCGGLTVYSPLVRNLGKDLTGKKVGIVGIGGLGHMAIKFAANMGAEVIAFSRSSSKKADAIEMGATGFVATGEEKDWSSKYFDKFDMILNCASSFSENQTTPYLSVLKVGGIFCSVTAPPMDEKLTIVPFNLIMGEIKVTGSGVGSRQEALDMLELCAEKNIRPIIEKIPISEVNCHEALTRVDKGDVRYRFVLTDYEKAFA